MSHSCQRLRSVLWIALMAASFDTGNAEDFIRGDVNQDGLVSLSDGIYLKHWNFGGAAEPLCLEAADLDDSGLINICDELYALGMPAKSIAPSAPFPDPGPDPTPGAPGQSPFTGCTSGGGMQLPPSGCARYEIQPAAHTDDLIALGDVSGQPGETVLVPVYLTTSTPVEGVQLVLSYDPSLLLIETGWSGLSFAGTVLEGGPVGPEFRHVGPNAAEGYFTAAFAVSLVETHLAIPPGEDLLVAKIRMQISPVAPGETTIRLEPADGIGPYRLRNELTLEGNARYVSVVPRARGGSLRIGIVGDVTFFTRGDADGSDVVDLSDAVRILGQLFLGSEPVTCEDAADANDSGDIDISDAVFVLSYLFLGGVSMPAPYPGPGPDLRPDFLAPCRA